MWRSWKFLKNVVFPASQSRRQASDCESQSSHEGDQSRRVLQSDIPSHGQAKHRVTECISQVPEHRETRRTRFQNGFNLSKKASPLNPPTHTMMLMEQPVVEPTETTPDDVRVSSEEESTDLASDADRYKIPNTRKPTGRHNFWTHVPIHLNCEVCKLTETTRFPCRKRRETRGDRINLPKNTWRCQSGGPQSSQHRCAVVVPDRS